MAEAAVGNVDSDIENTVNCPICFEYMLDSRTLYPCIHTFCEKCVGRLDRKRKQGKTGVDCPMCRGFVVESEIRKNRLINVLINLVTKEEDADEKQCGQCGNTKVDLKCLQCNIELCKNCNDRHKNIPSCRDHQLVLLSDISSQLVKNVIEFCPKHPTKQIQMNCVPCNVAICSLCKFHEHDLHKSESIEAALHRYHPMVKAALENIKKKSCTGKQVVNDMKQHMKKIEDTQKNITEELQDQKKKLLAKINADYEKLQQEVNDYCAAKIKEMSLQIEESEHILSSDESVVTYTEAIVANTDGGGLLIELQSGLMHRIEQLQLSNVHSAKMCEQLVFKPAEAVIRVDGNSIGKLERKADSKLQKDLESSQPKDRVIVTTGRKDTRPDPATRVLDFPLNVRRQIVNNGSFHVKATAAVRMCAFQDNLLIPNNNTLNFYTLEGKLKQTVTIKGINNIKSIRSVSLLMDGLVLATDTGLYQVDVTGNVISQLHDIGFKDVHVGEKHMAAIDESNTVYLWLIEELSTLVFSFQCTHRIDNVMIKGKCLYFSSTGGAKKIQIYDLQGNLMHSSGVSGNGGAGEFIFPRLCAVDCEDNLLVADKYKTRFHLLSTSTGHWSLLQDELTVSLPDDTVFVGDTLYVLTLGIVLMFTYK